MLPFHWFTIVALGIMLGYMAMHFFISKGKDYFFFSMYLFFTLLSLIFYFHFRISNDELRSLIFQFSYSILPFISYGAYFLFMEHLLEVRNNRPVFVTYVRWMLAFLIFVTIADAILLLVFNNIPAHIFLSNIVRVIVLISGTIASFIFMKSGGKVAWYFCFGTLVLILGGGITTFINMVKPDSISEQFPILNTGMFYYRSGILLQMLIFAMGISYKSKLAEAKKSELELELIKEKYNKELEKQKAVIDTRSSIAADLHDDIGATLSSINIYSKLAADRLKDSATEVEVLLGRIRSTSENMMDTMSDVIWAIKPDHDKSEEFLIKLRSLLHDFLGPAEIGYNLQSNLSAEYIIPMETRRNLYLILKEAVNNIVKYSQATEVSIRFNNNDNILKLEIYDNGSGFDTTLTYGNGLRNMKHRAEQLHGTLQITSSKEKGTHIIAEFEMTKINY
jgi:signal transduction histidine kinase